MAFLKSLFEYQTFPNKPVARTLMQYTFKHLLHGYPTQAVVSPARIAKHAAGFLGIQRLAKQVLYEYLNS